MIASIYKQSTTTVIKLAKLQSFARKKYFLTPALDKLLHAHKVYPIFLLPRNLKQVPYAQLIQSFQKHPFIKSSFILALLIIFSQITYTFQRIQNTIINLRPVLRKYLQQIDIEMLTCVQPILMAPRLSGQLKKSARLYYLDITS